MAGVIPPSRAYVKKRLQYDEATGSFIWRSRQVLRRDDKRWNTRYAGQVAGSPNRDGYIQIKIDRRLYGAHRLAWLFCHDEWPSLEVDHRNGNRADNRIANLRLATRTQQMANLKRPITNTSGLKGASFNKKLGRWSSYIQDGGKCRHLGYFHSAADAHKAYCAAADALHGEFARYE